MQRVPAVLPYLLVVVAAGCASPVRVSENFALEAPWGDYERIVVHTLNGDVDLASGGSPGIQVSGVKTAGGLTFNEAHDNLNLLKVVAEADADDPKTFVVELDYPERLRYRNIGADFTIRLPQSVAADVNTSNGRIQARGLRDLVQLNSSNGDIVVEEVAGRVEAGTSNGGVRASNVSGPLKAATSNGRVFVQLIGGECVLASSNGTIEAREVNGGLRATTSNGNIIAAVNPPEDGEVVLRTSNGQIQADLPAGLRGELSLRTSNGRVRTDFGTATLSRPEWSDDHFAGLLNGGGPARIVARTSNGPIMLTCR